jgi:hypothetical protein
MSDQYHTTACILCGRIILMSMLPHDICTECSKTSAPIDEIIRLRKALEEIKYLTNNLPVYQDIADRCIKALKK